MRRCAVTLQAGDASSSSGTCRRCHAESRCVRVRLGHLQHGRCCFQGWKCVRRRFGCVMVCLGPFVWRPFSAPPGLPAGHQAILAAFHHPQRPSRPRCTRYRGPRAIWRQMNIWHLLGCTIRAQLLTAMGTAAWSALHTVCRRSHGRSRASQLLCGAQGMPRHHARPRLTSETPDTG